MLDGRMNLHPSRTPRSVTATRLSASARDRGAGGITRYRPHGTSAVCRGSPGPPPAEHRSACGNRARLARVGVDLHHDGRSQRGVVELLTPDENLSAGGVEINNQVYSLLDIAALASHERCGTGLGVRFVDLGCAGITKRAFEVRVGEDGAGGRVSSARSQRVGRNSMRSKPSSPRRRITSSSTSPGGTPSY